MQDRTGPEKNMHDRLAPYWAAAIVLFGSTGLATIWTNLGPFWKGYVLDMVGPAWNYILFRGLFTKKASNAWTRFFTPVRTFVIFIFVCAAIEMAQYYKLYDATYDPWDFLAYVSFLFPIFLMDFYLTRKEAKGA